VAVEKPDALQPEPLAEHSPKPVQASPQEEFVPREVASPGGPAVH